jgi:hypothetical protein
LPETYRDGFRLVILGTFDSRRGEEEPAQSNAGEVRCDYCVSFPA